MRGVRNHPVALGALGLVVTVGMATGLSAVGTSGEPTSTYGYLKLFNEVLALVRHNYVETVADDDLIQGAYQGLLSSLDEESEYLTAAQYRQMSHQEESPRATCGIFITRRGGALFVAAVLPGSAADQAGVRIGDRIRAIDGRPARSLAFSEAQQLLAGESGSKVHLAITRNDDPSRLDLEVERREVALPAPSLETTAGSVAVARVPAFGSGSADALAEVLRRLHEKSAPRVIIDLRGNAWGEPQEAVRAASIFVGSGVQAHLLGRDGEDHPVRGEGPRSPWRGDLLLLTNPGTAHAAEIFVAALADAGVAVQAGETTLGRGGEREVLPLANGDYLLLTVRKYVSPKGVNWHGKGLEPAVPIPQDLDLPFDERADRQLERAKEWLADPDRESKAA